MVIKRWHKKRRYVRHVAGHKQIVSSHSQRYRQARLFDKLGKEVRSIKSEGRSGLIRAPSYLVKPAIEKVMEERKETENNSRVESMLKKELESMPYVSHKVADIEKSGLTGKDRITELRGLKKMNDLLVNIDNTIGQGETTLGSLKQINPDSVKSEDVKFLKEDDPRKGIKPKHEVKDVNKSLIKLKALKEIILNKTPNIGVNESVDTFDGTFKEINQDIKTKLGPVWITSLIQSQSEGDVDKSIGYALAKDKKALNQIKFVKNKNLGTRFVPASEIERVNVRSKEQIIKDTNKLLKLLKKPVANVNTRVDDKNWKTKPVNVNIVMPGISEEVTKPISKKEIKKIDKLNKGLPEYVMHKGQLIRKDSIDEEGEL